MRLEKLDPKLAEGTEFFVSRINPDPEQSEREGSCTLRLNPFDSILPCFVKIFCEKVGGKDNPEDRLKRE